MKKVIVHILLVGIVIIISTKKNSAEPFDTAYARILQTKVEQLRSSYSLVGITAAAYVPGQGMWLGSSGINSSDSDKITTDMVMGAGSVTKNFMSAIILQLAEADSLSLDDTLGQWLPPYSNCTGSATIRQMLDHSSGIHNVTDNPSFISAITSNWGRLWTIEEVLTGGYVLNPYFAPGTGWRYSNTNYMLLGLIIEKIMGTNLFTQFESRFYYPFQMNESYFEVDDSVKSPYAHNWADLNGDGVPEDAFFIPKTAFNSSTIGAGGVISRPENIVRYLRKLFSGEIINSSSISQMLTFRPANISGANGYGLGVMRYNVSGRTCYGHGGNSFGYTTVAIYDPIDSISIAVMMNKDLNGGPVGINFLNTVIQNNPTSILSNTNEIPAAFTLHQNFPNPFNPSTKIRIELSQRQFVTLSITNILGEEVEILYNGLLHEGKHSYEWNAGDLPSGVYFCKINSGVYSDVKRMLLLK